jgi:hypothetical protein
MADNPFSVGRLLLNPDTWSSRSEFMKFGNSFFAKHTLIRRLSITAAFTLFFFAVLTAAFVAIALIFPNASHRGLGRSLLNAYGLFAFLVPAWLVWASTILLSPVFSSRAIFALNASVVPFFTLATGFYFSRDFARFAEISPVLIVLGRHGYSLTIVVLALTEAVAIGALAYKLFPQVFVRRKKVRSAVRRTGTGKQARTGEIFDYAGGQSGTAATAPFVVVRTPLYGEIPLMREPEMPNPVDDVVLEEVMRDMVPDPVQSAIGADGLEARDRLAENPAEEALTDSAIRDALESLSPALTDLDMILNDLLSETPYSSIKPAAIEPYAESTVLTDFTEPEALETCGELAVLTDFTEPEVLETCGEPTVLTDFAESEALETCGELAVLTDFTESEALETCGEPTVLTDFAESEALEPCGELAVLTDFAEPEALEPCGELAVLTDFTEPEALEPCGEPTVLTDFTEPEALEPCEEAAVLAEFVEPAAFNRPLPVPRSVPKGLADRYEIPIDGVLKAYPDGQYWIIDEATRDAARILKETLSEFNIEADVVGIRKGPVITMFEVLPAPGVKLSRIVNLQDNIAMRLAAASVRIVAPIPGKHAVGIEIPNARRNIVSFRELIDGEMKDKAEAGECAKKLEIPVILGKDITGEAVTIDLATTPHLLIAGSTGSGKSVCVNTMILSILYRCHPSDCRLILVDPKIVELNLYNDIPHLLAPVVTEPRRALQALQFCICEMERRYSCLDSMHVRDIKSYNVRIKEQRIAAEHMPYIVIVIDEFADLMATTGKELETTVARLAAKSRAVGIHLVLATQRPSTDVITGLIKSNVPSRIAFMVASQIDSRIIIDTTGAEKLLGKGDMLYSGTVDPFPVRMQGAFVSEEEVERVVDYVKTLGPPDYIEDEIFFDEEEDRDGEFLDGVEDPLYERATEIVCQQGRASASYIQRRLKIGYNRAARLVELMESRGIVGPAQGSKPRELLRAV